MNEGFWERALNFALASFSIYVTYAIVQEGVIESGAYRYTREDDPGWFWTFVVTAGTASVVFILCALRRK